MTEYELAQALFRRQQAPDSSMPTTSQVRGVAASDSSDGTVTVVLDATAGGANAEMEVPTTGGITEGSEVLVTLLDGAPVEVSQAGSIDGAAGSATKYITETGSYGIRVHPEGDTANYSVIDADGMDVVKDGVSVAQFGEDARVGAEDGTHVSISATSTQHEMGTEDTSELGLYESTGTSPDLRLYNTTRTYDTPAGQMRSTEVGIELGQEGALSDGATIRSDIQPLGTTVLMTVGSSTGTRDSDANVTSVNGKGTAQLATHVDGWGDGGATATLGASANDGGSASVEVHADAESTSVKVVGESISVWDGDSTHAVHGAFPTHGMVGQSTNVPANGYHDFNVSFGHTYSSPPDVLLTLYTTTTATTFNCDIYLRSRSTTGFTARIVNREGSDRSPGFTWFAIG